MVDYIFLEFCRDHHLRKSKKKAEKGSLFQEVKGWQKKTFNVI